MKAIRIHPPKSRGYQPEREPAHLASRWTGGTGPPYTLGMDPVRGLIDRRVPWAVHDEIFSHQYLGTGPLLAQGWKLHVSATPLSCVEVLERALDVLLVGF